MRETARLVQASKQGLCTVFIIQTNQKIILLQERGNDTASTLTAQVPNMLAPLSLHSPNEQMENLSVMPPVEGEELLQGVVVIVRSNSGCQVSALPP